MKELKGDAAVAAWLGKVSDETGRSYVRYFARFYNWLKGRCGELAGMSPSELLDHQEGQEGRRAYRIADLIMTWTNELGGTHTTIKQRASAIRSFFKANRVELPSIDIERETRPTRPMTEGELKVEDLRKIVMASNELYRAVILTAFQGGLDAAGIEYFSNNGYESFREQVDRGEEVVMIKLAGRRSQRFKRKYSSMINGDAVEAIEHYIRTVRGNIREGEPIFITEKKTPLNPRAIQANFRHKVYSLGIGAPDAPRCESCGTRTTRRRLTKMKILTYECHKCGWKMKASEYNAYRGHRSGCGFHEIRDTFRTVWSKSPAQNVVAEYMMGHSPDRYGYDKSVNDEEWIKEQYLLAAPYLNLMSSDLAFGKVDLRRVVELEKRIAEQKTEIERLRNGLSDIEELREGLEEVKRFIRGGPKHPPA